MVSVRAVAGLTGVYMGGLMASSYLRAVSLWDLTPWGDPTQMQAAGSGLLDRLINWQLAGPHAVQYLQSRLFLLAQCQSLHGMTISLNRSLWC